MDEPDFTDLLDNYLSASSNQSYLSHPNNDNLNKTEREQIEKDYSDAKKELNEYMRFMRQRVHSHSDIFMKDVEGYD